MQEACLFGLYSVKWLLDIPKANIRLKYFVKHTTFLMGGKKLFTMSNELNELIISWIKIMCMFRR